MRQLRQVRQGRQLLGVHEVLAVVGRVEASWRCSRLDGVVPVAACRRQRQSVGRQPLVGRVGRQTFRSLVLDQTVRLAAVLAESLPTVRLQLREVAVDGRRDVPRGRLAVDDDRIRAGLGRPTTRDVANLRPNRSRCYFLQLLAAFLKHSPVLLLPPLAVLVFKPLRFSLDAVSLSGEVQVASLDSFHQQPVDCRLLIVLVVVEHLLQLKRLDLAQAGRHQEKVFRPVLHLQADRILGHLQEVATRQDLRRSRPSRRTEVEH